MGFTLTLSPVSKHNLRFRMIPTRTPALLKLVYPSLCWQVKTAGRRIHLTFDDGPHPEITPRVMDILESFGFKGTFFCIGDNVRKYPETYQSILDRGHSTGNHTFNHLKAYYTPNATYFENVEQCRQLVQSHLFRPPYGQITRAQVKVLSAHYKIIMWTLLAEDWNPKLDVRQKLNQLQRLTQNGDIAVFHDSLKAERNLMRILPEYLAYLSSEGYSGMGL